MRRRQLVVFLALAAMAQGCAAGLEDLLGLPKVGRTGIETDPNLSTAGPSPVPSPMARPSSDATAASPTPGSSAAPGASPKPGASPTGGPSATPKPVLPALPVGERSLVDRPDEESGQQIHAIYVIPSDTKDENLDTNGAVERSINAMNAWFEGQAKAHFRMDTYQGRPDISFVRLPFAEAKAREADGKVAQDKLIEAVANAGFAEPNKTYAIWYGGPADAGESCDTGGATTGRGGGGYAALYLRACTSNVPGGDPEGKPTGADLTIAHEIVHALGFVAECAPHGTSSGHTSDDKNDLMAASGGEPNETVLDPGRDDYFGHGREGCLDLARSAFLTPLPAGAIAPADRPMVVEVPSDARTAPLGTAGPAGVEALEAELLAKMQAARKAAGKPELPVPTELASAARRMAEATAKNQQPDLATATALSGYSGPVGANFLSNSVLLSATDILKGFDGTPPWLENDAKELGIAVVQNGARMGFAVAVGKGKARVESVAVAPGPLNTRTVVVRVRLAEGTPASRVHVKVGNEFYVPSWAVDARGTVEVLASVPNQGKTKVAVLLQNGQTYLRSAGSMPVVATLVVDGSASAEQAVSLD